MMTRSCAHCGQLFQPRPQVPNQTYCSSAECQRVRKRRWQQAKLRNDPGYRGNQRDAQRAWFERHPDYWRAYRAANAARPTINGVDNGLAKMVLSSGLYQLRQVSAFSPARSGGWVFEITPVCADCPCKKDV